MLEEGYSCVRSPSYQYAVEYFKNEKKKTEEKYLVRCFYEDKKLDIKLRLKNIDKYCDYIETLPPHIKGLFSKTTCVYCKHMGATKEFCKLRKSHIISNRKYYRCGYNLLNIICYNACDVDFYIKLIQCELESNGTKKNESKV